MNTIQTIALVISCISLGISICNLVWLGRR